LNEPDGLLRTEVIEVVAKATDEVVVGLVVLPVLIDKELQKFDEFITAQIQILDLWLQMV